MLTRPPPRITDPISPKTPTGPVTTTSGDGYLDAKDRFANPKPGEKKWYKDPIENDPTVRRPSSPPPKEGGNAKTAVCVAILAGTGGILGEAAKVNAVDQAYVYPVGGAGIGAVGGIIGCKRILRYF